MQDVVARLDHPDRSERQAALAELLAAADAGRIELLPERDWFNLHCHSFYSYNGYGASPTRLVWEAKRRGLWAVGLVDFDVLDGVDEFHAAGRMAGLRTTAGMETRVFIPAFADREINSPGEPGVAYHMGTGYVTGAIAGSANATVYADLRARAQARNQRIIELVNAFLDPVQLDYQQHVVPLTPAGVATERHLCQAYQQQAERVFDDAAERRQFWSARLGVADEQVLDDPVRLQAAIRSATMKRGGVGYQQPDADSFPDLGVVDATHLHLGALPTLTWLDGSSAGEAAMDELMDLQAADGVCAVNIIPDRNWNFADPDVKKTKVAELERFVALADARGWPIQIGTELNAPGLKWVDDFDCAELAGVVASFRRGARIIYGHHVARALGEAGYAADRRFDDIGQKNNHYAELGETTPVLPERVGDEETRR